VLPSTGVHVVKFTKKSIFQIRPYEARYALAYSSDRRAVAALGSMEFDAQVAFMGGAAQWACAGDFTDPEVFTDSPASERQTLSIVFVPRKEEEKAIKAIKKTMRLWATGEASTDPIGYFERPNKSAWVGAGLNFTPDGMIAAFVDTTGQLRIVEEQETRRERFFSPGGVAIKNVHELAVGHDWAGSAAYWEGDYTPSGSDLWSCAQPNAWDSTFNAFASDRVALFFNFLRAQMEAKTLREIVNGATGRGGLDRASIPSSNGASISAQRAAARRSRRL